MAAVRAVVAAPPQETAESERGPVGPRLDRLPIGSFHRQIVWLLGFVFFFELGDINTFSYAAPAIMKAWHLSVSDISFIVSASFAGMFIGATGGGWFADRVGRRRALILTTVCYSGFSLLNALVVEPVGLFATRFLTGIGLSAMTVAGVTYVSEMFPAARRGAYQGWIMMIGLCGIPVTAYVAQFSVPYASWGWRLIFVWGSLGLFFCLFAKRLEESPRWLENQGRVDEAETVVNRIEEQARREIGTLPSVTALISLAPAMHAGSTTGRFATLFSPAYRKNTIVLSVSWVAKVLGLYGFTSWVPTLLVAQGFSLRNSLTWAAAQSIGAPAGALVAALIADRWELRWLSTVVGVLIAIFGMIYGLSMRMELIIVFGFLVALLLQTSAALTYAYAPEFFPTSSRSSGVGLAYGAGRLANVFNPLLVAFLYTRYGYRSVFAYIALVTLLSSAVIAFGPLTKGRSLG